MQKGFSQLFLLLGIGIIGFLGLCGYWFYSEVLQPNEYINQKLFQESSSKVFNERVNLNQLSDADAVKQVTKNFYDWSVDCYDGMGKEGFLIANCASEKSGYVLNPISNVFCAQNIPNKNAVTVGDPSINQNEALIKVDLQWTSQKSSIYLSLRKINSDWKIASLSCSKNNLDGKVWSDIQAMIVSINIYYLNHKKLPKDFTEVLNEPENDYLKRGLSNNPFTNQPYIYRPANDGKSFEVSGEQSDGGIYTQKIEVD